MLDSEERIACDEARAFRAIDSNRTMGPKERGYVPDPT